MKKLTLIIILTLLAVTFSWAQKTVSGVVKDSDGNTLPGVNVVIKGTTTGTITDVQGQYSIEVPNNEAVLVFSSISYNKEEIVVGDRTTINVTMVMSLEALSEVVVVGYGVQKKSLVTGAIAKVDAEDLEKTQMRVEHALQGKVSGVNVMTESGSPGGGVSINIRGVGTDKDSKPQFIVDGMKVDGIEYLSPSDIESIEIMKDAASAAIYGSNAANGIVYITTKSGSFNQESRVSYSSSYGVQQLNRYTDVLNAKEYAQYYRGGLEHEIRMQYFGQEIPDALMQNALDGAYPYNPDTLGEGTNWMKEIVAPATMQQHNVSISGGSANTSYFLSGGYFNQNGIIGGSQSNFDRYTTRLNVEHKVKDWLSVGTNVSFTHFERQTISENSEFGGAISNAMNLDPLTPVYFDDIEDIPEAYLNQINQNFDDIDNSSVSAGDNGYYGMSTLVQNEISNPVAQIANTHNNWFTDKLVAGADITLTPIEGLTIKSTYDIDLTTGNNHYWIPKYYYHSVNYNYTSSVHQYASRNQFALWENTITYKKTLGEHSFTGLLGHSMEKNNWRQLGGRGEDMLYESWDYATISATLSDSVRNAAYGSYFPGPRTLSYFGRIQYDYKEKYLATVILRSDASSKLHPDNRRDFFPSFSLGWVPTKEDFWNFDPINFMKLRFSWGKNGNVNSLGDFDFTSTIVTSAQASYFLSGGTTLTGAEPRITSNPNLIWETNNQTNIGLDIRALNDRLTFTTELYNNKTVDVITKAPVAEYIGNVPPNANAGTIVNKGIELDLGYKGTAYGVEYSVSANATYNDNEVIDLTDTRLGANLGTNGAVTRTEQGYPLWYFYGYESAGIFDSFDEINAYLNEEGELIQPDAIPGDVIFKDINGDGVINEDDKTMIGSPHPDWTFGFTTQLNYRGFDFKMFLKGTVGNDIYYGAYRTDLTNNNKPYFIYEDAWTPEDHSGEFPRYTINDNNNNFSNNSLFVFDGSHLRIQNLELGYSFSNSLLDRIYVKSLRLYVSGQNLFVFTNYPGNDPEIGNSDASGNQQSIGIDRGLYPRPRIISFGLNITI